ncbi:uncharacterized protein LOC135436298 [Drosophila montana]|uniref:uncharacterized protein LOC135436298 n=1 Tax=Drosophila montana TaxID=40370 RepID=UPI00313A9EA4
MSKMKYQLLGPQGPPRFGDRTLRLPFKVLLGSALVLLVFYYVRHVSETGRTLETELNDPRLASTTTVNPNTQIPIEIEVFNSTLEPNTSNYYVKTSKCRMSAPNPFTADVLKIYKPKAYKKCDPSKDLITVHFEEGLYRLHMNEVNITCCYKQILRSGDRAQADQMYRLLPCSNFHQDFVVPQRVDAMITECRRLKDKKLLQQDAFGFVQPASHVDNRTTLNNSNIDQSPESRPSVLLWGIDSMSRMNFQRTMPLMYSYLREENWYELQGYNKMGDNTFPNLMAVLTGFNSTRSVSVCQPKQVGGLDACPMLWKKYKEKGYITAYAEDWNRFSTFNYLFKGFQNPPTDYYARPLILAVEKELQKVNDMAIPYCVGRRHLAEYIYDSALQFTEFYKNQSTFGMFWTNSFSHNNFALPSSMDAKILEYMHTLQKSGTFERSIILFFSDHGMRFGALRSLESGFLEERMPIMYIWLPNWFRQKYPELVDNLMLNRNRLTSPYDIHATLMHILELEAPLAKLPRPEGCPGCHSIFFEVAASRDCTDAGIDAPWCTCLQLEEVPQTDPRSKLLADQLVEATNNYLAAKNLTGMCEILKLTKIKSVKARISSRSNQTDSYLVRYETAPAEALFEATVKWSNATQRISISVPSISRMTAYREYSQCVGDATLKKFCICMQSAIK